MEISVLAERIIHDINVAFCREPNMDEFDIIPVLDSQNKSPVIHIGTKMALESWCVKFLYVHVHSRLMEWREGRLKEDDDIVAQLSELLLLLNPDVTTGWNIRKELLAHGKMLDSNELRLCKLILTRKPKSPEVFIHRRWMVRRLLKTENWVNSSTTCKATLVSGDLELCTEAATRYPNNYCAWCHREWIHDNVTLKYLNSQVLLNELKFSENYVQRNVSDHSGLQFRQYLLRALSNVAKFNELTVGQFHQNDQHNSQQFSVAKSSFQTNAQSSVGGDDEDQGRLHYELVFVRKLIRSFPGHEALWCHSRFVFHLLYKKQLFRSGCSLENKREVLGQKVTLNGPQFKKSKTETFDEGLSLSIPRDKVLPGNEDISPVQDELSFLSEMQADDTQSRFVSNHKRWLAVAFGIK